MKGSKSFSTASRRIAAGALVTASATAALAAGGTGLWSAAAPTLDPVEEVAATKKVAFGLTDGTSSLFAKDAGTGAALWDLVPDFGIGDAVDLDARGKTLFVSGTRDDGLDRWLQVNAYVAGTGDLLWSTSVGDGNGLEESNHDVVTNGKIVVASGDQDDPMGGTRFHVVAFDAKTGAVLWQSLGDQYTEATDLAMKGNVVAVVGDNYNGSIKAAIELFDVKTGANLGGHVYNDQAGSGFDRVAVGKTAIVAGGWADTGAVAKALTVAYDTSSLPLWDDIQGTDLGESYVQDVQVVGKVAIAAGFQADDFGNFDSAGFVRGFDLSSGDQQWEVVRDLGGTDDAVDDLTSRGKLLVGCGERTDPMGLYFTDVFGVDAKTGTVLWTASGVPNDVDGDCDEVAFAGKNVVFDIDGPNDLLGAASTK